MNKIKTTLSYFKKEFDSFVEEKKNLIDFQHDKNANSMDDSNNVSSIFPLKNDDDIKGIENKIKAENKDFEKKMVID